jgi:hypothetical protein
MSGIAVTIFAIGFTWQYGGWLLEWVGRAFGVRGLTSTYEAFVESFVAWIGASSVMQILAPWFLMGVGAVLFAALRWPARKLKS